MNIKNWLFLPLYVLLALGLAGCPDDDDDSAADDDDATGDDDDATGDDDDATGDDDDATGDDDDATEDAFVFSDTAFADYDRVDRAGMPAIATAVITAENKDAYNAASLEDDLALTFASDILGSLAFLHAELDLELEDLSLTPCVVVGDATGSCAQQALGGLSPLLSVVPDTLKLAAVDAEGAPIAAGFPNGRLLTDPVIDMTLAVILLEMSNPGPHTPGDLVGVLNPAANDVEFQADFPYLAPPHE